MSKKTVEQEEKKVDEFGYTEEENRKYDMYERSNLRLDQCQKITEDIQWGIINAHVLKGLSAKDLSEVFSLPEVVIQVLIAPVEASEQD